jgi:hypothetical protein
MNNALAEYLKSLPYKTEIIEAWPPYPSKIILSNRSWHITICDAEGNMDVESFKVAFNEEMLKKLKNEAEFYACLHETYKRAVENYKGFLK